MGLIKTVLKIDGLYYKGTNHETYKTTSKVSGWYDYSNDERNKVEFTSDISEAYITEGNRNLSSLMNKIMQRVKDHELNFKTIEIIKLD